MGCIKSKAVCSWYGINQYRLLPQEEDRLPAHLAEDFNRGLIIVYELSRTVIRRRVPSK